LLSAFFHESLLVRVHLYYSLVLTKTSYCLQTVRFLARFLYIILFHENEIISEDCRLERLDWVWILEPPRRLHEPSKREEFSNAWEEVICEFL
jgi:hypothetical protein